MFLKRHLIIYVWEQKPESSLKIPLRRNRSLFKKSLEPEPFLKFNFFKISVARAGPVPILAGSEHQAAGVSDYSREDLGSERDVGYRDTPACRNSPQSSLEENTENSPSCFVILFNCKRYLPLMQF